MEATDTSPLLASQDGTSDCDNQPPEQPNKPPRLITVEPVVVVYHMAFMSAQPLLQQYVYKNLYLEYNVTQPSERGACGANVTENTDLNPAYKTIDDEVAFWNIIIVFGTLMPSVLVTLILGAFSETLGRKSALVPPIAGTLIGGVVLFCVIFWSLPLWTIIFPVFLSGITGGLGSISLGAYAYMCDISSSEKRFVRIFLVELSNGVGTFLAHVSTGYLIQYTGFLFPVLLQIILQFLILVYTVLFLKETYKPKKKMSFTNCPDFKALVSIYIIEGSKKRRTKLIICLLLTLFIVFYDQGIYNILTFYLLDPPFCWGAGLIGLFTGAAFVAKSVGGGILTVLLIRRLQETTLLLIGCFSYVAYFLLLGFAKSAALAFTGAVCGFAVYLGMPMVRAVASKLVESKELGSLFAGLTCAQLISTVLGTIAFSPLYAWSAASWHGLVCIVAAGGMVIPVILSLLLRQALKSNTKADDVTED